MYRMIYYIYNGDELLGFIYNSNTYYYHKNIFGDIIGILDSNYNEVVTYTYNSWGLLTNKTDTTTINLSTINPFRYRSYYYDEETSLYYLNSRYYNPEWGRFVNGDGVIGSNGDAISQNLFAYTSNNFINYSDNDGYGLISALKKVVNALDKTVSILKKEITKAAAKSPKTVLTATSTSYLKIAKDYPIASELFNKSMWNSRAKLSKKTEKKIQKALLESEEFRQGVDSIIEKNYKFEYGFVSDMETVTFESGDLYYAFHNANIRVSCSWLRGYPIYLVTFSDMYDFTEYIENPKEIGEYANNLGYEMQKNGQLTPYYINMTFEYR